MTHDEARPDASIAEADAKVMQLNTRDDLDAGARLDLVEDAVGLYEDALRAQLDAAQEIACRVAVSSLLWQAAIGCECFSGNETAQHVARRKERWGGIVKAVAEGGLGAIPPLSRAMASFSHSV